MNNQKLQGEFMPRKKSRKPVGGAVKTLVDTKEFCLAHISDLVHGDMFYRNNREISYEEFVPLANENGYQVAFIDGSLHCFEQELFDELMENPEFKANVRFGVYCNSYLHIL